MGSFPKRCSRRPALLLEVIIAFALVALCVLPLIYPNVFIMRSERWNIAEAELDHRVNLFYVEIMQKLYQKEIPWSDIAGGKEFPLASEVKSLSGSEAEFPFTATYKFQTAKKKESDDKTHSVHQFRLVMTFTPNKGYAPVKGAKPLAYEYLVTIERKQNE